MSAISNMYNRIIVNRREESLVTLDLSNAFNSVSLESRTQECGRTSKHIETGYGFLEKQTYFNI